MGTVKQVFTGDIKQLESAYEQLSRQNLRMEQQINRLTMASEQGTGRAGRGMSDLNRITQQGVQQVANLAMQYIGFAAILRGVNAELDEMRRLQSGAATTQISVAVSQAQVIKNLPGVSSADRKRYLEQLQTISFPKPEQINLAAAAGLSAGGDPATVRDAVRRAAQISADRPEELDTIVAGALFMANATGKADARRNLGFILSAGAQSPIVGLEAQSRNLASAVGAMVGTTKAETTAEREQQAIEAGALFSALGVVGVDPRGESSRTSSIALAVQLRDFFTEGVEVGTGRRKLRVKPASDPGTIAGRVEMLQNDPVLRRRFLEKATFERQFQVPVEKLFEGGATAQQFRENIGQIRFDESEFDAIVRDLSGLTPEIQLANRQRESQANVQKHELGDLAGGSTATAREIRERALSRTRLHSLMPAGTRIASDWVAQQADDLLGRDAEQQALQRLRTRQEEVLVEKTLFGSGRTRTVGELSPAERRDFEFLAEEIKTLERMEATQQAQLEELRKMNQRQPSASAPANGERGGHTER